MSKLYTRLSIALLPLLFAFSAQSLLAQDSLENTVDEILNGLNGTDVPGGAVAYIEDGSVVFSKAYGLANLEHGIAWTTDTVSDMGSVSKQFIGFAFALLAEQGRLTIDDDIRLHLPQLPDLGETITIRHLFNHTSGLREIYNTLYLVNRKPGDIIFQEDAQTLIKYQESLQFSPGSQYLYNNTEYMLLADIIEAVTGQQYHEWMTENIFEPLDMHDTQIMHRQGQVIPRVATSYVRESDGQYVQRYDNSTLQGGGGIYSTVEDIARWMDNFSSHKVGTETTFALVTESGVLNNGESLNYGLGMAVDTVGGVEQWGHGGSSAGYRSRLTYLPEHNRGFILIANSPSIGTVINPLTEAFLGDVLELPPPQASSAPEETMVVPLENPAIYTGRYLSDELEAFYSVELADDGLTLIHRWLGSYPMSYLGNDQFDLDGLGGPISFDRNGNNEVDGFILDNGRTIGVEFRRIE